MTDKPILRGAKGGGGSSFVTKPDNLRSNDTFELLFGLGSGRWKGLVNGLKSLRINGVPLENEDGSSNFEDVRAIFADGNPLEDQIVDFQLGGGGSVVSIGTQLANPNSGSTPGPWVTGAVSASNAEFIDIRLVVQALFYQDEDGIRENTANVEIQMRPSTGGSWINPFTAPSGNSVPYSPNGVNFNPRGSANYTYYLPEDIYLPGGTGYVGSQNTNLQIKGKTTSPFVKELRISVPNQGDYAGVGWEVRARLREQDSVDGDPVVERRTIVLESLTGITQTSIGDNPAWDGQVWLQLIGKATNQFSGFPRVEGDFETKICQTPPTSVWNPETREYLGPTWDGSYQEHFTTDPAWQMKEFIEDPIHGVAGLSPGATLDKWDALEASQYYSELVPDGRGGTHPRFNMNLTINEAREVNEQLAFLAGSVNSYIEDVGNGQYRLKVDKPETPKVLFTEDNIFGDFEYSHTDVDTRFNDWRGTFINEDFDYQQDSVRVFDASDIITNGRRFTEIALIGCTNRQEALRRLEFRKRVALNEFRMVSFATNRAGRYLSPLDTILVADGGLNADHLLKSTSRLGTHSGTTVNLQRPVRLEVGVSYNIHFSRENQETISRAVTNSAGQRGDVTQIFIDSALPGDVLKDCAVSLEATGLPANPLSYRILSVERDDEDEDLYMVNASIIDAGKWNAMDNVVEANFNESILARQIDPPGVPAGGVLNLKTINTATGSKRVIEINWERPDTAFFDSYALQYRIDDGNWVSLGTELTQNFFELEVNAPGLYDVQIVSNDIRGIRSFPLEASVTVAATEFPNVDNSLIDIQFDDGGIGGRGRLRYAPDGSSYIDIEAPSILQNSDQFWADVGGPGRPADNATVGADWANNLSGRPGNVAGLTGTEPILNEDFSFNFDEASNLARFRFAPDGTNFNTVTLPTAAQNINQKWSDVGGSNRPQDNATIGADWTTNLENRPGNVAGLTGTEPILNEDFSFDLDDFGGVARFRFAYDGANFTDINLPNSAQNSQQQWADVGGSGRPDDNATFGATWGTNLSGRPANVAGLAGSEPILNEDFAFIMDESNNLARFRFAPNGSAFSTINLPSLAQNSQQQWADLNGGPQEASFARSLALGTMNVGGFGDLWFEKNFNTAGANNGEIRVRGTRFYHPDGTTRNIVDGQDIVTPFEGGATSGTFIDNFFVIWTDTDPRVRFDPAYDFFGSNTPNIIVGVYDHINNRWFAVDNGNTYHELTPIDTDCILAVGSRLSGSTGITNLYSFVGTNTNLPEDGATIGSNFVTGNGDGATQSVYWPGSEGTSTNIPSAAPAGSLSIVAGDLRHSIVRRENPIGRFFKLSGWMRTVGYTGGNTAFSMRSEDGTVYGFSQITGTRSLAQGQDWTFLEGIVEVTHAGDGQTWAPALDYGTFSGTIPLFWGFRIEELPGSVWSTIAGVGRPDDNATNSPGGDTNLVPFSLGEGDQGWSVQGQADDGTIDYVSFDGDRFFGNTYESTASGQSGFIISNWFRVEEGQRYSVGAGIEARGEGGDPAPSSWRLYLDYATENFAVIAQSNIATGTGTSQRIPRRNGFTIAPTNAKVARLIGQLTSSGAGTNKLTLSNPMVSAALETQTLHPAFVPGPNAENAADVSKTITGPASVNFDFDSSGTIKGGQIGARTVVQLVTATNVTVTSGISWSVSVISGSWTGSNPSISGSGSGQITYNSAPATAGRIRVSGRTSNGQVYTRDIDITISQDPPPTGGGGGGGGSSAGTNTTGSASGSFGNSWTTVYSGTVSTASGVTSVSLTANNHFLEIDFPWPSAPESGNVQYRWQRESSPGSGTWTDIGSITNSSPDPELFDEGGFPSPTGGAITNTMTDTGRAASTEHSYRLRARISPGESFTVNTSGSVQLNGE